MRSAQIAGSMVKPPTWTRCRAEGPLRAPSTGQGGPQDRDWARRTASRSLDAKVRALRWASSRCAGDLRNDLSSKAISQPKSSAACHASMDESTLLGEGLTTPLYPGTSRETKGLGAPSVGRRRPFPGLPAVPNLESPLILAVARRLAARAQRPLNCRDPVSNVRDTPAFQVADW